MLNRKEMIHRNYYMIPNAIFTLDLCAGEIAVYNYLLFLEDRNTYTCYPSYRKIGSAVKMNCKTVAKYVRMLEGKHLIETEPTSIITQKGIKKNGNLKYTILPITEATKFYVDSQGRKLDAFEEQKKARILKAVLEKQGVKFQDEARES